MKALTEKDVTTFKKWWESNEEVMKELNVSKHAAKLIWSAACDAVTDAVIKSFMK